MRHFTKARPVQANHRLPTHITEDFIRDLNKVLESDDSPQARYQKYYFLSKYTDDSVPGTSNARRSAALTKWLGVEERNQATNLLLREHSSKLILSEGVVFDRVLDFAAKVASDVLGPFPSLDIASAMYSGGASTSKRRVEGHPALKFLGKAHSTRLAWTICRDLFRGTRYLDHIESGLEPEFVVGSVFFTVPKNSVIDRVACKEPDINMFLQKMFGDQIRRQLRRVGINLNDQSINGELARQGSIHGKIATLDLSSASDSVTTELVRRLLPPEWFYWLNVVRSHKIDIDGEIHNLQMFSSMGNGFTFELESLLFYSLTRAACYFTGTRGRVSVYGDDIIAPASCVPLLIEILESSGFSVNTEKSFIDGPFRESCGSYYYDGLDVKPFFLKGPITRLTDLIKVLNALCAWASRVGSVFDPRYERIHTKYKAFIPESLYGGQDLTSITSLVTGDAPRKELRETAKQHTHSHIGGYLYWMQLTATRIGEGSIQVSGTANTGLYRMKRNRQQRGDLPIFLHLMDEDV